MSEVEIVLRLSFELNHLEGVSYACVTSAFWVKIQQILLENPRVSVYPYMYSSGLEYIGKELKASELLNLIDVIEDPVKVEAFNVFHGSSFFTIDDLLGKLFKVCAEYEISADPDEESSSDEADYATDEEDEEDPPPPVAVVRTLQVQKTMNLPKIKK